MNIFKKLKICYLYISGKLDCELKRIEDELKRLKENINELEKQFKWKIEYKKQSSHTSNANEQSILFNDKLKALSLMLENNKEAKKYLLDYLETNIQEDMNNIPYLILTEKQEEAKKIAIRQQSYQDIRKIFVTSIEKFKKK